MSTLKLEALRIIHNSAVDYKGNLVNRNVMFITVNFSKPEIFETSFLPRNFLHLTGVRTKLNSTTFYSLALRDRLSEKDIDFTDDGTTAKKLDVLRSLMNIHKTARMVGDYDHSQRLLVTDKLAGTITSAMGFRKDGDYYMPNTALKTDVRIISKKPVQRIAATFLKSIQDDKYNELTYLAKGFKIEDDFFAGILKDMVSL